MHVTHDLTHFMTDGAVTVCQAPPQGFLEDQMERGWWAGSDAG